MPANPTDTPSSETSGEGWLKEILQPLTRMLIFASSESVAVESSKASSNVATEFPPSST